MTTHPTPPLRLRVLRDEEPRGNADFVLYWMTAARRSHASHALDRALHWAHRLERPLVVLEALRVGYRWACDRIHHFVMQGMLDNQRRFEKAGVGYFPYVERTEGEGHGLLAALSARAAVVVTDDFPCFFLPRMLDSAVAQVTTRFEAIDGNGLLPLRAADHAYPTAYAFRRFLQKTLAPHLAAPPVADPLARLRLPAPPTLDERWPRWDGDLSLVARLPIDHSIAPSLTGGAEAARQRLREFVDEGLPRYASDRSHPDVDVASGLSPYLHFGHLGPHQALDAVLAREGGPPVGSGKPNGKREGWWGLSAEAEAFLDELVTWRELGYNMCAHRHDYDRYESLPDWAKATLAKHAGDPRPTLYTLDELAAGRTHDEVWNAAQRQLVAEGRIQNYLRMLWGKKILEWTRAPQEALAVMIELNNRYALDGRNPNSYSGIFWVLGRYDRPWGPERPIFGTVRYMSSANTVKKLHAKEYLARWGG
jgi:deoxyribodipyrimidine photo-lyase